NRAAHDARADGYVLAVLLGEREPYEAQLRTREEEIERAGERAGTAVAVSRARRAIVGIAAQEFAEESLRTGSRRGVHPRARDDGGRRGGGHHAFLATTSGSSAARILGGIGAGRCVARFTQTWTKRPVAAASSSPWAKMPIS